MSNNDPTSKRQPGATKGSYKGNFKKKPYSGHNQRFQERPSGHATEPPMLRWGRDNNLLQFTKILTTCAGQQYGQLAHAVLVERKAIKISMPKESEYDVKSVSGRELLKLDIQDRSRRLNKIVDDKPKLHYYMYSYLSQESEDAVKSHEDFDECKVQQDPLTLWKIIEETHRSSTQTRDRQILAYEARDKYHHVRQGPIERIIGFKERFDEALRNYQDFDRTKPSLRTSTASSIRRATMIFRRS